MPDCSSKGRTLGRGIFQSGCVCGSLAGLIPLALPFRPSTPFALFLDAGNAAANVSNDEYDHRAFASDFGERPLLTSHTQPKTLTTRRETPKRNGIR